MARYALSFASYQSNICQGLSNLQQNGEFVDMTLAADGHVVKVHKMVLSLASPYFKEIISTAEGNQPLVYLNKVSSSVLTSLLEYIYTGLTHVEADRLDEFMQIAKDLHITGLTDLVKEEHMFDKTTTTTTTTNQVQLHDIKIETNESTEYFDDGHFADFTHNRFVDCDMDIGATEIKIPSPVKQLKSGSEINKTEKQTTALYTVSNQGTIQMIFNRYIYTLSYVYLKKPGYRKWRCVDAKESKCPAIVVTESDLVVERTRAHNHPFHDKRILKKMNDQAIFSTISDIHETFAKRMEGKESESE